MNSFETFAIFGISATTLLSLAYFLILDKMVTSSHEGNGSRAISLYIWRKITGFVLFGLVPAAIAWIFFKLPPLHFGLAPGGSLALWPWLVGASAFFILLNFFNSKNPELYGAYPEMRLSRWSLQMVLLASGGWILYLTGYEFLFRGILLGSCYEAFGLWPAIVINLALYSALHLPKGLKEAVAAIPFGALICYLTIESQSILPAIFIHSMQAVSCEICCIWRNPDMKFNFSKTHKP